MQVWKKAICVTYHSSRSNGRSHVAGQMVVLCHNYGNWWCAIKSLWRLVVCYRERELADLKYQKKKLNQCMWHIIKTLKSPFAGLLCSYRSHTPLFTKFGIETCDFMHINCSYCKLLSQKISRDKKISSDNVGQFKFRSRAFEMCLL